jgi:hypothetical protein
MRCCCEQDFLAKEGLQPKSRQYTLLREATTSKAQGWQRRQESCKLDVLRPWHRLRNAGKLSFSGFVS